MKLNLRLPLLAAAMAGLLLGQPDAFAQQPPPGGGGGQGGGGRGGQRGNFDPAQMQERRMQRYREMLEITAEDEWKAIQPMVQKVTDAQREANSGGMAALARMMGRGPGGGGDTAGGGNRRGFGGESSPEEQALQKAIESKAPAADVKNALAKYRDARKAKEAKLAAAQDALRQVLSARQEAQAVLAGLLH